MPEGCLATMSAVTHRYGQVVALDGLDLEIRPGEVLAVLGPNGAGKTTAIGLLLGSLRAQEGAVRVFGCDPGAGAVRMRRGAMLQVSGLADTLTIAEHLELFSSLLPGAAAGLQAARDGGSGGSRRAALRTSLRGAEATGDVRAGAGRRPGAGLSRRADDRAGRRGAPQPVERDTGPQGGGPHSRSHHALPGGGRRPRRPDRRDPPGTGRRRGNAGGDQVPHRRPSRPLHHVRRPRRGGRAARRGAGGGQRPAPGDSDRAARRSAANAARAGSGSEGPARVSARAASGSPAAPASTCWRRGPSS